MADSSIGLSPAVAGGDVLDAELLDGKKREVIVIGGDDASAEQADVRNAAPGAADYGLVTRNVPSGTQAVSGTMALDATTLLALETTRVQPYDVEFDETVLVTPQIRDLATISRILLFNDSFRTLGTLDLTKWRRTLIGSGTAEIVDAQLRIATGAVANSTARVESVHKAQFESGSHMQYRAGVSLTQGATADNVRRWGMFDDNDGFFFELDSVGLFSVTRRAGVDTRVASTAWTVPFTTFVGSNRYEVSFFGSTFIFAIAGEVKHTMSGTVGGLPRTRTLTFPLRSENTNSGGSTTDVVLTVTGTSAQRYGPVFEEYANRESSLNSTVTPLAGGATYTGTFEDVLPWTNMSVLVKTSHASATDGLKVEWSTDGVNVDTDDVFTLGAGDGKTYSFGVIARFVRVRYVNGAVAQTSFRLQMLLHKQAPKPSSHRILDSVSGEDDAELVKAVITGKTTAGGGGFVDVKVNPSGALTVAATQDTSPWVSSLDAATLAALESITVQNGAGAAAVNIQDGGNVITVDGVVTANLGTIDGAATEATLLTRLTDTQLRATPVPVSGTVTANQGTAAAAAGAWPVRDDYQSGEILADQTGAAAVLTFTFASAVQLVVVDANGVATDVARADPFGGTPTATLGIPCRDETATFIPVTTSSVKVFAPLAMVVSVFGYRRA